MDINQELTELSWELGAAARHCDAMWGAYRNNPSSAAKRWLHDARLTLRHLKEREIRLHDALVRDWDAA